jgi:peptidoglycan/xylan/chitin deacetylase (PgdA/CDA1 family)
MSLRPRARRALLGLSYHARGALLWDLAHRRRIRLLIYHGVPSRAATDEVTNRYGYNITADELERHMEYLVRRCHVMRLDDALAGRGLSRTRINVVVTFDDGYENNCTNALPILERLGVPAVFALATSFVQQREPLWNDAVEYAVTRSTRETVEIEWEGERREWSLADPGGRVARYNRLLGECTQVEQERRPDLVDAAVEALAPPGLLDDIFDIDDYRPMTPEQVAEMAASDLVEIASHSVHHYLLTRVSPERRRAELVDSKREIEALTGRPCPTFCVPGGQYDAALVDEALEAGYTRILTSDGGFTSPGRRLMGRLGILRRTDPATFADMVHGPVDVVLRRLGR